MDKEKIKMKNILVILLLLVFTSMNFGQVKVVATTSVIYDLVKEIGKDKVEADYICRGDQDPHYVEILPSYMLKLRKADLFFKIGLGLEIWAQQLIDGSRNDNLKIIDLSNGIEKKEIPAGKVDASLGDIHPYGNPHYWLDPYNAKIMATEILEALLAKSPENSEYFKKNYQNYISALDKKLIEWNSKMKKAEGRSIVFFHASWIYFAERYGLKISGYVEPKPGIPPTPSHNAELYNIIKKSGAKVIVMENYYSDKAPNQIASQTGIKVIKVPIAVFGMEGIDSYIKMMDYIINNISSNL